VAYEKDEKAASDRFKDKKVKVTAALTGVFIPSTTESIRLAEKGYQARAFVTMVGQPIQSAEESFFSPGIKAHSVPNSFFGLEGAASVNSQWRLGETVTLACTVGDASRVSDLLGTKPPSGEGDYSLDLEDCTLLQEEKSASLEGVEEASKSPPLLGFSNYKNEMFGYSLDYPQFFAHQTSQDANQETFLSPDGRAQLILTARNNPGWTLAEYQRRARVNIHGQVLYQEAGSDWFTIVWRDGEKREYLKTFIGPRSVNSLVTTFPESWRPEYDAVVSRMEASFKPGDTGNYHH
jgi:hypothetical protein